MIPELGMIGRLFGSPVEFSASDKTLHGALRKVRAQRMVYEALSQGPATFSELVKRTNLPAKDVEYALNVLGKKGYVVKNGYFFEIRRAEGMEVTYLIPHVEGTTSLLEYVIKRKFTPLKAWRWCTDKFKVRVMARYLKEKAEEVYQYVGINADEKRRVLPDGKNKYGLNLLYPLVDAGIGRAQARQIIREHGLPVPPKSGCYICPFQGRERLMKAKRYQCIWEQIKLIESFPPDIENAFRFTTREVENQRTLLEVV